MIFVLITFSEWSWTIYMLGLDKKSIRLPDSEKKFIMKFGDILPLV